MMRYRKTATVKAMQWLPPNDPNGVLGWLRANDAWFLAHDDGRLALRTLESGAGYDSHAAKPGDWIIQGVAGEFYACDQQVFADTYEPVPGDG